MKENLFLLKDLFTLEYEIYKYMTSISNNMYIDKLNDIVNKYNNTQHKTVKMKAVDVKLNIYINSGKEIYNKDPKFKIRDIVRISKNKNSFRKVYTPNWFEEVFMIKKVKNTMPWTYFIMILIEKNLLEYFTKKNCKKRIGKSLELKCNKEKRRKTIR